MIKTEQLVEFLVGINPKSMASGGRELDDAEKEKITIIIHRLKYLDQIKEEISNSYSGIVASELFENNDL